VELKHYLNSATNIRGLLLIA